MEGKWWGKKKRSSSVVEVSRPSFLFRLSDMEIFRALHLNRGTPSVLSSWFLSKSLQVFFDVITFVFPQGISTTITQLFPTNSSFYQNLFLMTFLRFHSGHLQIDHTNSLRQFWFFSVEKENADADTIQREWLNRDLPQTDYDMIFIRSSFPIKQCIEIALKTEKDARIAIKSLNWIITVKLSAMQLFFRVNYYSLLYSLIFFFF